MYCLFASSNEPYPAPSIEARVAAGSVALMYAIKPVLPACFAACRARKPAPKVPSPITDVGSDTSPLVARTDPSHVKSGSLLYVCINL